MLLSEMYRIPWTKHDNPNGWIEVTTECQLDCQGCYRAVTGDDSGDPVAQMRRLKADVAELARVANAVPFRNRLRRSPTRIRQDRSPIRRSCP